MGLINKLQELISVQYAQLFTSFPIGKFNSNEQTLKSEQDLDRAADHLTRVIQNAPWKDDPD